MDMPDVEGKIMSVTAEIYGVIIKSPVFIAINAYGR
jgi:hypothetical protein